MFRRRAFLLAALLGVLAGTPPLPAHAATPPGQPKTGPGAELDPTTDIVKRAIGKPGDVTYVFHLAAAPATPRSVVVVLHGWGAANPVSYGAWIEHLARRGHLVLFPGFQEVGTTKPGEATDRAAELIKGALAGLATDPQAKPDPSRLYYLGHSAGSAIAMNLAAGAPANGLVAPKLVFATMAGGVAKDAASRGILLADLSTVDPSTAIVTMVGDREFIAADRTSRRMLREASAVPVGRKLFMRSASDDHGFPALTATLASVAGSKEGYGSDTIKLPAAEPPPPVPGGRGRPRAPVAPRPRWSAEAQLTGEQRVLLQQVERNLVDTLDYLAYWRVFDMLVAATASGNTDLVALRQDPNFLEMGRWSDGWPVRRLTAETPKAEPAGGGAAPTASAAPSIQSKQPVTRKRDARSR